jgi:hypothetical protein
MEAKKSARRRNSARGADTGIFHICHAVGMRDAETIESELMEISAIADDSIKLERIVAWCASHPDEVAFAIRHLMGSGGEAASASS